MVRMRPSPTSRRAPTPARLYLLIGSALLVHPLIPLAAGTEGQAVPVPPTEDSTASVRLVQGVPPNESSASAPLAQAGDAPTPVRPGLDAVIIEAPDTTAPDPAARSGGQSSGAPSPTGPSDEGIGGWGMAPIRWGGSIGAGLRRRTNDRNGSRDSVSERLLEARLRASSYIAEPWIARVAADLALTQISSNDSSPSSSNLRGSSITGNLSLNVFPLSRFPFQASLSVSDSRTDGSLVNADYTRTRLSLRQEYRPATDTWSSYGQYDRSRLEGSSFGTDTVDRVGLGYNLTRPSYTLTADGSYTRNDRSEDGAIQDVIGVVRHSYRPAETVNIETLATYTDTRFDLSGSGSSFNGRSQGLQLFSFGSWNPVDSPWRGTGSLRYFRSKSSGFEFNSVGGTGSLSYQFSPNLSAYGSLSLNRASGSGRSFNTSTQTVGLNYSGTPLIFGNYSYYWYGTGAFTNVQANDADQRAANLNLGHSLTHTWALSPTSSFSTTGGQSISTVHAQGVGALSTRTLTHSLGVAYRSMPSDAIVTYLAANVSDNRTTGDAESDFRLFNVQASGTWRLSGVSEASMNITWQKTTQSAEFRSQSSAFSAFDTDNNDTNVSGSIYYSHLRAFGVRGLRYTARIAANTYRTDSRQSGNPDATREQVTRDFDQRLYYRIGRLNTELQMRAAEVDGRKNALIFFKVTREFGAF